MQCDGCGEKIDKTEVHYWWDDNASYSTKLYKCPICGYINIVKYANESITDVNNDIRYFIYR